MSFQQLPQDTGKLPLFACAHLAYARWRRRVVATLASKRTPNEGQRARFVTVNELAVQLRVSNMTVYRLVQSGELPAVRVGRSYRIREEDVDRFLAQGYTRAG
ncbi:MAG: helix-turn-helix domain-containing protein [Acidimicrobiales bacterium]